MLMPQVCSAMETSKNNTTPVSNSRKRLERLGVFGSVVLLEVVLAIREFRVVISYK